MKALFSRGRFVCLFGCNYRRLFSLKLLPNWLTTMCLWRGPLRYDYHLPKPCSPASLTETTHTRCIKRRPSKFPSTVSKVLLHRKSENREQINAANKREEDSAMDPHSSSVGV